MSEPVAANSVVTFHYTLKDESGAMIERSEPDRPVVVLQGQGHIVRGLDRALLNHRAGESFSVSVAPEMGYGLRRADWTQRVSKKHFPHAGKLKAGMEAALRTEHGLRRVTVVKVGAKMADVDMNHPLAGRTLCFDVELVSVRAAEPEELAHGHAHGPGGHHH